MQIAQLISSLNCKYDLIIPPSLNKETLDIARDWSSQQSRPRSVQNVKCVTRFHEFSECQCRLDTRRVNRPWIARRKRSRGRDEGSMIRYVILDFPNERTRHFVSKIASRICIRDSRSFFRRDDRTLYSKTFRRIADGRYLASDNRS